MLSLFSKERTDSRLHKMDERISIPFTSPKTERNKNRLAFMLATNMDIQNYTFVFPKLLNIFLITFILKVTTRYRCLVIIIFYMSHKINLKLLKNTKFYKVHLQSLRAKKKILLVFEKFIHCLARS